MLKKIDITYLYYIPYLLSAIFSLKSFWLKWPKPLRTFSIYLFFTLIVEIIGVVWKWELHKLFGALPFNIFILNIGMIVGRAILLLYFFQLLSSDRTKKIIARLIPVYLVLSLVNYFLIQGPGNVNTYSINLGSILVIVFCIRYFAELLNASQLYKLHRVPDFWIATGTFIYFLISLPFITSFDLVAWDESFEPISGIFMSINDILMIFTYTLYLIAYLCRPHLKSQYKPSSSPH